MKSGCIVSLYYRVICVFVALTMLMFCIEQGSSLAVSSESFILYQRMFISVPQGRTKNLDDVYIRHFVDDSENTTQYRFKDIKELLTSPSFDLQKPTVIYAHGWIELATDKNVQNLMRAYTKNGEYNALLLDWSNFAFGDYILAALSLKSVGTATARAIMDLLSGGLQLATLHLVGHSMGAELLAQVCKKLSSKRIRIQRLTCLDAAYPGFHPPILGDSISSALAEFVDVIHTNGGQFGTPVSVGHADFWPNGGQGKQPGCPAFVIPLTAEDLCSHWRSHGYWAESLLGGRFLARHCSDYQAFLRGECNNATVASMGVQAEHNLRGNFYLKTATSVPYALGEKGVE